MPTGHPGYRRYDDPEEQALQNVYNLMVQRCINPNDCSYHNYGGRGIKVSPLWLEKEGREAFKVWARANGWKRGIEMDRINNDGNYEPGNVRFVSSERNSRNRRSTKFVCYKGVKMPLQDAIEQYNNTTITRSTVYRRLKDGWTVEDAIELPCEYRNVRTEYVNKYSTSDKFLFFGKLRTLKEAVSDFGCPGVSYKVAFTRIKYRGWHPYFAVLLPAIKDGGALYKKFMREDGWNYNENPFKETEE